MGIEAAMKLNILQLREVLLKRPSFIQIIRAVRDFGSIFDVEEYRSHVKIIGQIFPRLHYLLRGNFIKLSPCAEFRPEDILIFDQLHTVAKKNPFFYYLLKSSGKNPVTSWDSNYLQINPEAFNYDRPLLLHYVLHNFRYIPNAVARNYSTSEFILKTCTASDSVTDNQDKLELNIEIQTCQPILVVSNRNLDTSKVKKIIHSKTDRCELETKFDYSRNTLTIFAHDKLAINHSWLIAKFNQFIMDDSGSLDKLLLELSMQIKSFTDFTRQIEKLTDWNSESFYFDTTNFSQYLRATSKTTINSDYFSYSQTKKILLVSHEDSRTGAPIFLSQLADALSVIGFQIDVISLRDEFKAKTFEKGRYKHEYLSAFVVKKNRRQRVLINWLLTKIGEDAFSLALNQLQPDLVIVNSLASADTIRVLTRHNIPSILYVHEAWDLHTNPDSGINPFHQAFLRGLSAANKVFFGSNATERNWRQFNIPMNASTLPTIRKLEVPDFFTRASIRSKMRTELGISGSDFVFLSIATFEPRKRLDDIVRAFQMANLQDSTLILVGRQNIESGKYLSDLCGSDNRILVLESQEDLSPFYAGSDCLVFASEQETMPLVLQEAATWQLPRIISKYNGFDELVTNADQALLFEIGNLEQLSSSMRMIHANPEFSMGIAGAAYKAQMEAEKFAESTLLHEIHKLEKFYFSYFPKEWATDA